MLQSVLNVRISTRTVTEWKQQSRSRSSKPTRRARPTTALVSNYPEGVNVPVTVFALKVQMVNRTVALIIRKTCQLWWFNWLNYGTEILLLGAPRASHRSHIDPASTFCFNTVCLYWYQSVNSENFTSPPHFYCFDSPTSTSSFLLFSLYLYVFDHWRCGTKLLLSSYVTTMYCS